MERCQRCDQPVYRPDQFSCATCGNCCDCEPGLRDAYEHALKGLCPFCDIQEDKQKEAGDESS